MSRSTQRKTGTREWSVKTVNCLTGCTYGCRYCFARADALRFKRIASIEEWTRPVVQAKQVSKSWKRYDGLIMFPSAHDFCSGYRRECFSTLENLLQAGNRVLVVTKPSLETIRDLCTTFSWYRNREQILFRFTIGTLDRTLAGYWEPGAPWPSNRLLALYLAHQAGFATSVSMEPLLDAPRVDELIRRVDPLVTETIWIGTMREIKRRVIPGTDPAAIAAIRAGQTPEMIRAIHGRWKGHRKIRWKDSYRKVLGLEEE